MFARVLIFAAMIAPVFAQDADDVTKYLTEMRAKVSRDGNAWAKRSLAIDTERLESTTDRKQKADLYANIALLNESLDDLDAGVTAAPVARELAPEDGRIGGLLARLLVANGQPSEASPILGADATDGEALVRRAELLVDNRQLDLAVVCLQLAQKTLPADAGVDDRLGVVYLRAERIDDAIRTLNRAEAKAPDSALIHLHLAFAFGLKDYGDYARTELKQALDCHPSEDVRTGIEQLRALLDAPK